MKIAKKPEYKGLMVSMICVVGLAVIITSYILFIDLFMQAYANPGNEVCRSINDYGEATPELIVLVLTMPAVALYVLTTIPYVLGKGCA